MRSGTSGRRHFSGLRQKFGLPFFGGGGNVDGNLSSRAVRESTREPAEATFAAVLSMSQVSLLVSTITEEGCWAEGSRESPEGEGGFATAPISLAAAAAASSTGDLRGSAAGADTVDAAAARWTCQDASTSTTTTAASVLASALALASAASVAFGAGCRARFAQRVFSCDPPFCFVICLSWFDQGYLGIYYYVETCSYGMFRPRAPTFPVLGCRSAGKLASWPPSTTPMAVLLSVSQFLHRIQTKNPLFKNEFDEWKDICSTV